MHQQSNINNFKTNEGNRFGQFGNKNNNNECCQSDLESIDTHAPAIIKFKSITINLNSKSVPSYFNLKNVSSHVPDSNKPDVVEITLDDIFVESSSVCNVKGRQICKLDNMKQNVEMKHNCLQNTHCESDITDDENLNDSSDKRVSNHSHKEKLNFDKTLKVIVERLDVGLTKNTENSKFVKAGIKHKSKNTKANGNQKIIYYPLKSELDEPISILKCQYCSFKSKIKSNFEEHLDNHKNSVIPVERNPQGKRLYKCKDCQYETYVRNHLERHYRIHRNRDEIAKYKCDQCKYKTADQRQLNNHRVRIHSVETFFCFNCDYKTCKKRLLIEHMVIHLAKYNASENIYECPKCCYTTTNKHNFQRHFHNVHEASPGYGCSECDYRTKNKNDLQYHVVCHKKSLTLLKCPFCSFETYDIYNFSKHRKIHKPALHCDQCDYLCTEHKLLRTHIKNHHEAIILYCHNCIFNTPVKYRLIQHMKIHRRIEKPTYKCKYCDFKTKDRMFFRKHVANHEGGDKSGMYHCDRCDFSTKYNKVLKRHQRAHQRKDEAPIQCSVCSRIVKSKSKLEKHMLCHKSKEEVVLYKCRICRYETKYKGNLIYHIKIQHDECDSSTS